MDDQNFKRVGDVKKREDQILKGKFFLLFLSIKTYVTFYSCYSSFSSYYTKTKMPRKVDDCLVVLNTMNRILEEL